MRTTATAFCKLSFLFTVLTATSAHADFSGPYGLIPPVPGRYSSHGLALPYGNWLAFNGNGIVDTRSAPTRLQLESPSFAFAPFSLRFETQAAASGIVSFDYTTVSRFNQVGGGVNWLWQPVGGNRTFVPLDLGPNAQLRHFDFQVQTGDQFGFLLLPGPDVAHPGEPLLHVLMVENFVAPVPEPTTSVIIVVGCLLGVARRWRSQPVLERG